MGLFSFVKNAGASLFGSKKKKAEEAKKAAEKAENEEIQRELNKALELENFVGNLGLAIDNFSVKVDDDVAIITGQTSNFADKEKAVLAVGNVEGIAQVDDQIQFVFARQVENVAEEVSLPQPEPSRHHTVVSGDSLSKIAKTYYGDAMKYPVIFEANKPMLKDPSKIYPGQVLRIPHLA